MSLSRLLLIIIMCSNGSTYLGAKEKVQYLVGAEALNYYPHQNFNSSSDRGFAWAVLNEFAEHEGTEFVYIALPIRRLQKELEKGTVDFAYPDNPK